MKNQQYEIVTGALAMSGRGTMKQIMQGEVVPEGMLSDKEVRSLLADGRIRPVTAKARSSQGKSPPRRGKWSTNPGHCVGKDLETLLLMVLAIDEKYDVTSLQDEAAAVRQLTADWNPAFDEGVARAVDRTEPVLRPDARVGLSTGRELDAASKTAIQKARERAGAELAEKGVQE